MSILASGSLVVGLYKIYLKFFRWLRPKVALLANSTATSNASANFFSRNEISTCSLGVDLHPVPHYPEPLPYIIYYGRVMQRKGALWFAEQVLPHLHESLTLKVIGPEWEKPYFDRLVKCDRVEYAGVFQSGIDDPQLRSLIASAVCCILPNRPMLSEASDIEGFGLVALELASYNPSVIASNLDGFRESIIDGVTGFLVDPESANAWVQAVERSRKEPLADRASRLMRSRDVLARSFGWDSYMQHLLAMQ